MTRDDILSMQPGPEMDALVATRVMGLDKDTEYFYDVNKRTVLRHDEWHPSTDIANAWEVMEKLKDHYPCVWAEEGRYKGKWRCLMAGEYADVLDESACIAICKGALLATLP